MRILLQISDQFHEERGKHILKHFYSEGFLVHWTKNYVLAHLLFGMLLDLAERYPIIRSLLILHKDAI